MSHVIVLSTTSKKLNKMKTTKRTIMHCCLNDRFLEFFKSRLYAVCDHMIYNDFSQLIPEVVFSFQGQIDFSNSSHLHWLLQDPPFFEFRINIFREGARRSR